MLIDDGLELLDEAQCRDLLAIETLGRVGITVAGLPVILPINYAYVDGDIVFRTAEGTKLHAATEHAVIAFEVDAYDAGGRCGWSVLVVGRCAIVADAAESARIEQWVQPVAGPDHGVHCVRLHPEFISGRRIGAVA